MYGRGTFWREGGGNGRVKCWPTGAHGGASTTIGETEYFDVDQVPAGRETGSGVGWTGRLERHRQQRKKERKKEKKEIGVQRG